MTGLRYCKTVTGSVKTFSWFHGSIAHGISGLHPNTVVVTFVESGLSKLTVSPLRGVTPRSGYSDPYNPGAYVRALLWAACLSHADRLVCMSGDLFGPPQAASSHQDHEGLGYLRRKGLQIIHRCPLRFSKVPVARAAGIARPSSMAPCAPHETVSTGDSDKEADCSAPSLALSCFTPSPLFYHPFLESLPKIKLISYIRA